MRRIRGKQTLGATFSSGGPPALVPPVARSMDPGADLLRYLRLEVEDARRMLITAGSVTSTLSGTRCPLCPWYASAAGAFEIAHHLYSDHTASCHFVASGTKQLRMCMSMYEADLVLGTFPGSYLKRSSDTLRHTVRPGVSSQQLRIDRFLRLILDGTGPRMMHAAAITDATELRRVGNILYTRTFAEALLREIALCRSSVREAASRLQASFLLGGCVLGSLMPEHPKTLTLIITDIITGDCVTAWTQALLHRAWSLGEFAVLSVDGTWKAAMGVLGCRRYRLLPHEERPALSAAQPADDRPDPPRILTVRGWGGFLLGAPLVRDESGRAIRDAMLRVIRQPEMIASVRFVVVDHCSRELQRELQSTFPNLVCVCEDTVHLVMKAKATNGHKPNAASRRLSALMDKFNRPMAANDAGIDGDLPWVWGVTPARSSEEADLLRHAREGSLPVPLRFQAAELLASRSCWMRYGDYLLCMASLISEFPDLMQRRTLKKGKTLARILLAACDYSRFANYRNNSFMRSAMQQSGAEDVPVGTAGNEALHAELRNSFRQVYCIHAPTLEVRLATFVLAKQVAWDAACRAPGLRQRSQQAVLCRALARSLFAPERWTAWVARSSTGSRPMKAVVPSRSARHAAALKLRARLWPRALPRASLRLVRRTVFTKRRRTHLTGGGSSWSSRAV
jgi:hypothetical protein